MKMGDRSTVQTMACLSIQNPWAWLIAHGYKTIENRDWATSFRGRILLHTGKQLDTGGFDGEELHAPYWYRAGAHSDVVCRMPRKRSDYDTGGIIGIATLIDVVTSSTSPWFRGTYGFVLKDAKPLPFIPLRGQPGIFPVQLREIEAATLQKKPLQQLHIDW